MLIACATLVFGPRFVLPTVYPGHGGAVWESLQSLILLAALVCNLAVYGRQRGVIPWPSLLVSIFLVINVATGVLGPESGRSEARVWHAIAAWVVLALPWFAAVPKLQDGSTRYYAYALASLAALSAALGLVLQLFSDWSAFSVWSGALYRFNGATRGDYFAGLAFGGVAIATHEWTRRRGRVLGALATISAILLILSGSRTAIAVTGVWMLIYVIFSPGFRASVSRIRSRLLLAVGGVLAAFLLYLPVLRLRMSGLRSGELDLSGRDQIWGSFFEAFKASPWLGLGLGSAQPGVLTAWLPHNEYLRLLVELGIVGGTLYLVGVVCWTHAVGRTLQTEDRPYLIALMAALALYSLTDNPISACYITPFIYLGALLSSRSTPETQPSAE